MRFKAVTLIELLVAIVLLSVIVLGFASLIVFSHYHVISSDRRAKLQNEVSYLLEHMNKEVFRAVGNEIIDGANSVIDINPFSGNKTSMIIFIDADLDGRRSAGDYRVAYCFRDTGSDAFKVRYCPQCNNNPCTSCSSSWQELSVNRVKDFSPSKPGGATLSQNYSTVDITACWNPSSAESSDNPCVTMRSRIKMPSVSIN